MRKAEATARRNSGRVFGLAAAAWLIGCAAVSSHVAYLPAREAEKTLPSGWRMGPGGLQWDDGTRTLWIGTNQGAGNVCTVGPWPAPVIPVPCAPRRERAGSAPVRLSVCLSSSAEADAHRMNLEAVRIAPGGGGERLAPLRISVVRSAEFKGRWRVIRFPESGHGLAPAGRGRCEDYELEFPARVAEWPSLTVSFPPLLGGGRDIQVPDLRLSRRTLHDLEVAP